MDWREYEKITKYIYETLGHKAGVKILGHGRTCKVKGKSGVEHQIDVLTSHSDGIHDYKTAIECKFWEKRVNKDVVMKMAKIIEDAGINKGVIVSKTGFTEDGISFAKYKNIGLVKLREIEESDQKAQEKMPYIKVAEGFINIQTELRRPEILGIDFDFINPDLKYEKPKPSQLIVRHKDGKEVPVDDYLTSFRNILHENEPGQIVEKYYGFKDATLVNKVTNEKTHIRGFTLKGKLTVKNENLNRQIEIVDKVWMLMKALFENDSFTISKWGMIKKDK